MSWDDVDTSRMARKRAVASLLDHLRHRGTGSSQQRRVLFRSPVVVVMREPHCRCGHAKSDGRHEPLADCQGHPMGCSEPAAHHRYRAQPWWHRFGRWHYWDSL